MSRRIEKVNSLLKVEISNFLERNFFNREVGILVVTKVDTLADLSEARVWISPFNKKMPKLKLLKALSRVHAELQRELGKLLYMRKVPKIVFKIDINVEYVNRIEDLLAEIRQEKL